MLVSAAMSLPRKLSALLTIAAATFMLQVSSVGAQVIVDPAVPSERNDGGWVYWLAIALSVLALLIIIRLTIKYMRYAPRFSKDEENLKVVRADRVQLGRELPRRNVDLSQAAPLVVAPPAVPAAAPALAPVGAVAAPAEAAPAPAPAESAPQADEGPPGAAPEAAPQAADAAHQDAPEVAAEPAAVEAPPAAPAPAAPEERVEVTMDQEAYEAALKEHLDAGTDRRIAEGKAKRAGMIAARKKATGEA